jgi:hypothetical protein
MSAKEERNPPEGGGDTNLALRPDQGFNLSTISSIPYLATPVTLPENISSPTDGFIDQRRYSRLTGFEFDTVLSEQRMIAYVIAELAKPAYSTDNTDGRPATESEIVARIVKISTEELPVELTPMLRAQLDILTVMLDPDIMPFQETELYQSQGKPHDRFTKAPTSKETAVRLVMLSHNLIEPVERLVKLQKEEFDQKLGEGEAQKNGEKTKLESEEFHTDERVMYWLTNCLSGYFYVRSQIIGTTTFKLQNLIDFVLTGESDMLRVADTYLDPATRRYLDKLNTMCANNYHKHKKGKQEPKGRIEHPNALLNQQTQVLELTLPDSTTVYSSGAQAGNEGESVFGSERKLKNTTGPLGGVFNRLFPQLPELPPLKQTDDGKSK